MELKSETSLGSIMGAPQLPQSYKGSDLIEYCTSAMQIKPTMLAALLNVTERTLINWSATTLVDDIALGKFARLKALYQIVNSAENHGIKGKVILNLLNEPIPRDEEEKTLLYYVVEEPNNSLLKTVVDEVIRSFK